MRLRQVFCAVFLLLLSRSVVEAQIAADIRGRVLDSTGAAVRNATVELTRSSTKVHLVTTSSNSGDYFFSSLTPGTYQLDVAATGFEHLTRTGVTAIVGQTVSADLILTLGGGQQTVKVTANAPLLQSETSNVETNIPGATVIAMPLNTRNFVQLTTLAPGVELPPGTLLPRINGGRPRTNEYLYDGISALQPEPGQVVYFPIIDDIQEFTVEANNVGAQFGRFNGGVINVATRSGSNALHGSLFEFFRNEDLNARNYFAMPGSAEARIPQEFVWRVNQRPVLARSSFLLRGLPGTQATHRCNENFDNSNPWRTAGHFHRHFAYLRSDQHNRRQRRNCPHRVSQRRNQYSVRSGCHWVARAFPHTDKPDRQGE